MRRLCRGYTGRNPGIGRRSSDYEWRTTCQLEMPLTVLSLCRYLANRSLGWRSEDYDAYKWIQALKGGQLNGYGYVPVDGVRRRLSNQNLASCVDWFGRLGSQELAARLQAPFLLIPVPNSACVLDSSAPARTRRLARAIATELSDGSMVLDCLRWKKNLGSASHEGGPRAPAILYGNLAVIEDRLEDLDLGGTPVLVDDVTTSGGHLQACAARIRENDITVTNALCGGKTVYDQNENAFARVEEVLDDFAP